MQLYWITYYLQCMCCKNNNKEEIVETVSKRNSINVAITDSSFIVETNNDSMCTTDSFYTNNSLHGDNFEETIVTNPVVVNQIKTQTIVV